MIRRVGLPGIPLREFSPANSGTNAPAPSTEVEATPAGRPEPDPTRVGPRNPTEALSADDQREVERLQKRDAEVRAHEQAHARAGGQHAGSPEYKYETGPDGKRYVVDGKVSIDSSVDSSNPEASIQKLEQVARAANAPAQPSAQDLRVAANARAKINRLRTEQAQDEKEIEAEVEEAAAEGKDPYRARAAADYARAGRKEIEISSFSLLACRECGGAHGG